MTHHWPRGLPSQQLPPQQMLQVLASLPRKQPPTVLQARLLASWQVELSMHTCNTSERTAKESHVRVCCMYLVSCLVAEC